MTGDKLLLASDIANNTSGAVGAVGAINTVNAVWDS
jgi:hypothetical protein